MRYEEMSHGISQQMGYATNSMCILGMVCITAMVITLVVYLINRKDKPAAAVKENA